MFSGSAAEKKWFADIEYLRNLSSGILKGRVESKQRDEIKDLLTAMLKSQESETEKGMTDESIIDNLLTFLIAGTSENISLCICVGADKEEQDMRRHRACYHSPSIIC